MRISQEQLNELLQEDYQAHEERLRTWIQAAEAELAEESAPHEEVYGLLFWAQVEFHRRRRYLALEKPELEFRGAAMLKALADRMAAAETEKKAMESKWMWQR